MLPMLMSRAAPMSLPSEQTVHGAGNGKVKEKHSLGQKKEEFILKHCRL